MPCPLERPASCAVSVIKLELSCRLESRIGLRTFLAQYLTEISSKGKTNRKCFTTQLTLELQFLKLLTKGRGVKCRLP